MPLQLPVLDDRDFEQLLDEAKRRIPSHTPEWTNFNVDSDPGITMVQLFAFLTDNLLYRANRIPERNRLKFLQLLGIPLQPAAAADGIITIRHERGPVAALTLEKGVVVAAGDVHFLTRDDLTVLPLEGQVYYKREIDETDPEYETYRQRYEAVRLAAIAEAEAADPQGSASGRVDVSLLFYETTALTPATASNPSPVLDLVGESIDDSLYIALLAPKNVSPDAVRHALAHQTLSIGVVPALEDNVPALLPEGQTRQRTPAPDFIYEIADVRPGRPVARYARLRVLQQPDVLSEVGIVKLALPGAAELDRWEFPEPEQEGTGDFPPRVEDEAISRRLVTWLRLRLPDRPQSQQPAGGVQARLTAVGVNAARVTQAVPVSNEPLGTGNGEPDQVVSLANTPVLPASLRLEVQDAAGAWQPWRLTDDLLAADLDDEVFTLDPESGQIRFGTGLNGARPPAGRRRRASYEYGGGPQGNVAVGAINKSRDVRLQGGYKVENPVATWGGDRGESVADGERHIPLVLRHRDRLVTAQDFRDVTWRTPGVDMGRVEVLSLFRPARPDEAAAGVVTIMVVPAYDALFPATPAPNRLFLRLVCDHLLPRRLITTELYVRGPEYVPVYLTVGVAVRDGHYRDAVLQAVRRRLEAYLSSLPPGGPDETGWPLERGLLLKDLEAVVTRVAGVAYVESMEMQADATVTDDFPLRDLQLPRLVGLNVNEGPADPLAAVFGDAGDGGDARDNVVPVPISRASC